MPIEPIPCEISSTVTLEPLTCEKDSVTVCPPADDAPFHVIIDSSPPVSGTTDGGATETTLAAILVELGQKLEPGGEVALNAATLAALENITVTVSNPTEAGLAKEVTLAAVLVELGQKYEGGAISLDAGTLAALETVTVLQGTSPWVVNVDNFPAGTTGLTDTELRATPVSVSLDIGSLAALETIDLGATSLAALETITVNGVATEVTLDTLLAEFRNKYDVVKTATDTYITSGDHTLIAPPAGQSLRVVWIYAQAKAELGAGVVIVTITLGTNSYVFELTGSQPFAHGFVWEGAVNQALIVNTSSATSVIVNADYRSF